MKIHFDGLSSEEVKESLNKDGNNNLLKKEQDSFLVQLWETFSDDPIIKILILALIVESIFFFLGYVHWYEPIGIAIAVILATFVSTWSEYSSESQFLDLQEKASRIKCKVFRDGKLNEILIGDIVRGDYILLESGDKVPVDGILKIGKLKINQSALNGENEAIEKLTAPHNFNFLEKEFDLEDSPLMNPYKLFRESVVEDGVGVLKAINIGKNTLTGGSCQDDEEDVDSPLKVKLNILAEGISKFGYIGGTAIAIAFMLNKAYINPQLSHGINSYFSSSNLSYIILDLVQAIILAVIIIVVAVPEGLPMMIAAVLSLNMKKLLKDNILVRKLIGIETAGSINILFSDKTGTITEGKLKVVNFLSGDKKEYLECNEIPKNLKELLEISLSMNTNAILDTNKKGESKVIGGNITEKALLQFIKENSISEDFKILNKINFNSEKKFGATQITGKYDITLIKGAPDKILDKCTKYYTENGVEKEFTMKELDKIEQQMHLYAEKKMRMIAVATTLETIKDNQLDFNNLTLVGIISIRDDIKPDSAKAISDMERAGVQVVMITGDRKDTAHAIAKELKILNSKEDIILTSKELENLTDEEVINKISKIKVIARALPQDKLRLVKLAQSINLVVGMTGDGVNDAPALQRADVGFTMGSGTEVAKEAAEIVVLDDSLTSIAKTCLYGRTIYKSIQKFIQYQLTVNFAAILVAFLGPFIGFDFPLSMSQMLWVNLIMDTLAALALGGEPSLDKYLDEKPKKRDENIISPYMWSAIVGVGSFIVVCSIFFLKSSLVYNLFGNNKNTLLTAFFTFFIFLNAFNIFNVRSGGFNLLENISENKMFKKVVFSIFFLQILMIYFGGNILRTYGLSLKELLIVILAAFMVIPFDFIRKKIFIKNL